MKSLIQNWEEALAAHEVARSWISEQWRSAFTLFKKGDKVWLDSKNLKTIYHKKMKPKQEGPFTITKVLGPVTYKLQLPKTWRIHNVFHATLLCPYKENSVHGENFAEPPPDIIKSKQFLTTGNKGGDINILSNGGDIQSPMPHGNQTMYFQMMATSWHSTNFDMAFDPRPFPHYAFFWPTNQCELGIWSLLRNAVWNPW